MMEDLIDFGHDGLMISRLEDLASFGRNFLLGCIDIIKSQKKIAKIEKFIFQLIARYFGPKTENGSS